MKSAEIKRRRSSEEGAGIGIGMFSSFPDGIKDFPQGNNKHIRW
jgi:hypothetical protein